MSEFKYFQYHEKLALYSCKCDVCGKDSKCYQTTAITKDTEEEVELSICLDCISSNNKYILNGEPIDNFGYDLEQGKFKNIPNDIETRKDEIKFRTPPLEPSWQGNLTWPYCDKCGDLMVFLGYPYPTDLDELAEDGDGYELFKKLLYAPPLELDEEAHVKRAFSQINLKNPETSMELEPDTTNPLWNKYTDLLAEGKSEKQAMRIVNKERKRFIKMSPQECEEKLRSGEYTDPYAIFLFRCRTCNDLSLYMDWQ
jgi:uncharacterized protein CbrC (UPF0167 family)